MTVTGSNSTIESRRMNVAPWVLLVLVAALLRIVLALHPGLWSDEIFSLAMATGHSLEHPANEANPALGDYVESRDPKPPSTFRRYAEHDASPAVDHDDVVEAFSADGSDKTLTRRSGLFPWACQLIRASRRPRRALRSPAEPKRIGRSLPSCTPITGRFNNFFPLTPVIYPATAPNTPPCRPSNSRLKSDPSRSIF